MFLEMEIELLQVKIRDGITVHQKDCIIMKFLNKQYASDSTQKSRLKDSPDHDITDRFLEMLFNLFVKVIGCDTYVLYSKGSDMLDNVIDYGLVP